jgi:hypothetical protein
MRLVLDRKFRAKAHKLFNKYSIEVGVLTNSPYRKPLKGERGKKGQDVIGSYAGGPVRRKSREIQGTVGEVSDKFRENTGINYLTKPFEIKENKEILRFTRAFFMGVFGKGSTKRMENLAQAIIRNPILRGDYGSNSALTKKIKGFDRFMFDTGQLFQSIKAKVLKRNV